MAYKKFAVSPGFEEGGSLFKPEQLAMLGSIVGADAKIELTTFKQLYIEMDENRIEDVQVQLRLVGLDIQPAGFYTKNLNTCNFCRGAADAGLDLAKRLDQAIAGKEVPSPLKIGYAGCALGTSEPLLKDISVVKMNKVYDVYVGGEAKGIKARLGELFVSGIPEEQVISLVTRLITVFQEQGKKKEKFSKFVERITKEELQKVTGHG
ncbi:nitrite reductase [Paenibacillus glycanilyticus]|uniref:nitrite reductase n=1 Tax=Paenibacillus glycanilyticus TaxID=126569 RepID=UPI0020403095|nr:nitrite reductase [Paenibacillus glycanilyticus]MCM3631623.1 nitrite reductase [Paenibacillus glycanilyticus]